MQITIIGHATILIETGDFQNVVDPYFGAWGNIAYRRLTPPTRTREALAGVDLVLASHNHWDHIDGGYLRMLAEEVPTVAPRWMSWMTRLIGAKRVVLTHLSDELDAAWAREQGTEGFGAPVEVASEGAVFEV